MPRRRGGVLAGSAVAAAAGCAAALAVAAAPAGAETTELRVFSLTAEGHGGYHRHDDLGGPADGDVYDVSAAFRWKTTIPRLVFTNEGTLIAGDDGVGGTGTLTGSGVETYQSKVPNPTDPAKAKGTCTIGAAPTPSSGARVVKDVDPQPQAEPGVSVVLRPFSRMLLPATCTGGLTLRNAVDVWSGEDAEQFDQGFFLPSLALNQGKIIQNVSQSVGQATFARCPHAAPGTTACALSWSGTVTLDLVEVVKLRDGNPDDVFVPLPAGAADGSSPPTAPAPAGTPAPAPTGSLTDDELVVPLPPRVAPRSAALTHDGATASVSLTCAAACAGAVTAFAAPRASRAAAAVRLGRRAFRLVAGRRTTVKVALAGRARRAALRAGAVRLVITTAAGTTTVVARRR